MWFEYCVKERHIVGQASRNIIIISRLLITANSTRCRVLRPHRCVRLGKCPTRAARGGRGGVASRRPRDRVGGSWHISAECGARRSGRATHRPPTRALSARAGGKGGRRMRAARVPLRRGACRLLSDARAAPHLLDRSCTHIRTLTLGIVVQIHANKYEYFIRG